MAPPARPFCPKSSPLNSNGAAASFDGFPHIGEGLSFCDSRILRRQLKRRYVLSFFQKAACQVGIHDDGG
jgi:hypothetical protein